MITLWSVRLKVDSPHAKSLSSSLASEEEITLEKHFLILLERKPLQGPRAMWNTRMRSLVIASKLIEVMDS